MKLLCEKTRSQEWPLAQSTSWGRARDSDGGHPLFIVWASWRLLWHACCFKPALCFNNQLYLGTMLGAFLQVEPGKACACVPESDPANMGAAAALLRWQNLLSAAKHLGLAESLQRLESGQAGSGILCDCCNSGTQQTFSVKEHNLTRALLATAAQGNVRKDEFWLMCSGTLGKGQCRLRVGTLTAVMMYHVSMIAFASLGKVYTYLHQDN